MTIAITDQLGAGGKPKENKPENHAERERARIEREEDDVTLQSDESFPASDPPSFTPVRGSRRKMPERKKKAS
ncbi:MAG TPA: hypothetical protein VNQ56_13535 [Pseudolabrys sp.]|nr:hypothetical protein [Pseudolabrys sp.]